MKHVYGLYMAKHLDGEGCFISEDVMRALVFLSTRISLCYPLGLSFVTGLGMKVMICIRNEQDRETGRR